MNDERALKACVVIYSRPGCHLCEEAKLAILEASCGELYTLAEVNIEGDLGLLEKYGNDVPVITIDGAEAFRHTVDPAEFRRVLASNAKTPDTS